MRNVLTLALAVLVTSGGCASEPAGGPRVLVVMNEASPDSVAVAHYYAEKRGIDAKHICKIKCPTDEVVKDTVFQDAIRGPIKKYLIESGLQDRVDYIVLTKGIPIRTVEHWGVDSALTCLFHDYTDRQPNPYFNSDRPFRHQDYEIYLVTRLDGLTVADAKALVDRSLAAKPDEKGLYFLDVDPKWNGIEGYDMINVGMREAAKLLKSKGVNVEIDETPEFCVRTGLVGYFSWGANDHSWTEEAFHKLRFLPGSIAETAVSTSAYTLTADRTLQGKRSYITDLVAQGVTCVKGYVYEPFTPALALPDVLFDRYTSGFNMAESFYAASRFIHWRDIVLGDPLCAPYAKAKGPVGEGRS